MLDDWLEALARLERLYDDSLMSTQEFLAANVKPDSGSDQ